MSFINKAKEIYNSPLVRALLHNSVFCLIRELKGCKTVLDLGCGNNSPLAYFPNEFCVGVEYFMPYLIESKKKNIHKYYIRADINKLEFKPGSFDAVLILSVIEHMDKEPAMELLDKALSIARSKVIVLMPNGYIQQGAADENELQAHKSGWEVRDLARMGFKAHGADGLKLFRKDTHLTEKLGCEDSLLSTIRFRPKLFWLIIAELSQAIAYYFPQLAFEVFYVKDKRQSG